MDTHTHRPMHGVVGWYCGACGEAMPEPKPTSLAEAPASVLIELVTALIAMRGAA